MSPPRWTVIKVGGSLFDLPDLATRLRALFTTVHTERIALFPGGGRSADAVRELDRTQELGDEASHWLALRALTMNAHFLQALLPEFAVLKHRTAPGAPRAILDPFDFAQADEANADHLPHTWEVTSDSLAARVAVVLGAQELILVKSVSMDHHMTWPEAAAAGLVDAHFPTIVASAKFPVRVVNTRTLV
jgi:aspartokinase-like uncharacterized kinase